MFVDAIETAAAFTRAIHSIRRYYASTVVLPGSATLFFVNAHGWALTCAHVAKGLQLAEDLAKKYKAFKDELASRKGEKTEKQLRKELERKYGYSNRTIVEVRNRFMKCIEGELNIDVRLHEAADLALLRFHGFERLLCSTFPVFPKDTSDLKQGKSLCRLGFPFPEFTNFTYDETNDTIRWTESGRRDTPRFPMDGMVTRHVVDNTGAVVAFEMSTPGLRGQSGGPAFDVDAKVWGMQSRTGHLDLDFDVDQKVIRSGLPTRVQDSAFLHVGICVHVDVLKSFMQNHGVDFQEG